jgi:predicted N-acetyltransferase YhbS
MVATRASAQETGRIGVPLPGVFERIDIRAVHRFLCEESYWAQGRTLEVQERLVREALRVVGLYRGNWQLGFCRTTGDGVGFAYLADVHVTADYPGRGLGEELVREMVERGPLAARRWLLHTNDMHRLYREFGFDAPDRTHMQRPARGTSGPLA